mgnify:CR=1 FL=1
MRKTGDKAFSVAGIRSAAKPLVMGVVNVTPDSFSGDGIMTQQDYIAAAIAQAQAMERDGADMIDVGGESSRPGHAPVAAGEEIRRVIPVIAGLRAISALPIAVDTTKAEVAAAALDAGADIVNDISALRADPAMAPLIAARDVHVILMHNRSRAQDYTQTAKLGGSYAAPEYGDFIAAIVRDLKEHITAAEAQGIQAGQIIIDPGLGFGKTAAQNRTLIRQCGMIAALGYPVLLGPSRKSFIGQTLDLPVAERLEGTLASCIIGWQNGAKILRVHDVRAVRRALDMAQAILCASGP